MIGILIGTASVIALAVLAGRGHHHGHGWHGGPGGFRRRALRRVFERIDASPAQEKAILEALDTFRDRVRGAKEGVRESQKDVAEAFRAEHLDPGAFGALFDGHLGTLSALRDELASTMASVHDVLTPKQRERLADLVESGPPFGRHHRHAW